MINSVYKDKKNNVTNLVRSTRTANKLLLKYYNNFNFKKNNDNKVAWVGVDIPAYIFRGFGITPVFPQVHSAFQAQRKAVKTMMNDLENNWQIPHNICGEVKGVIGSLLCENKVAFDIPKPDILITSNSTCGQISKGFKFISNYKKVDLINIDFPFIYDEITEDMITYVSDQIEEMLYILENKIGYKMNLDNLNEGYAGIYTFAQMWKQICEANIAIPAPVNVLDLFLFTSCFLTMDANEEFLSLIGEVYNEVFRQIQENKNNKNQEKFRVLWHYLPIYSKKKFFKELFDEHNVSVVASTYIDMYDDLRASERVDLKYPIASTKVEFNYPINKEQIQNAKAALKASVSNIPYEEARKGMVRDTAVSMLEAYAHKGIKDKYKKIKKMIKKYNIDGVILHNDRSCRPQSLPQYQIQKYILDELGIPVLFFDSDTMDERYFSESQITTRFEAFIEKMESRKNIMSGK